MDGPTLIAMWLSVQLEAYLEHPSPRVYRYLADPASWPDFAPAVHARHRIDDGPLRVGSRWAAVDHIGPFPIRFTDVLEILEPDRRVVWRSTSPWNSRVEYVCIAEGSGTQIHATYEGDVAGWLRLLGLLPNFVWVRILRRDFRGLGRLLDAEDPVVEAGDPSVA
jgi:Polyketide cyclase / dehydrase and lipid transport